MAGINMSIGLEDKVTPAFSKMQKQALANIQAYNNLEKQLQDLDKTEQKLWDRGMQGTQIYKQVEQATADVVTKMQEYEDGTRNAVLANEEVAQSSQNVGMSMMALNQTLELAQKGWQLVQQGIQKAYEWMDKYNTQFNAEFTAGIKMHNILGATDEEIQSMYDYAAALQKVGVIGDEVIIAGMAELSTTARTTEQVRKLIPQVLNLAVAEKGLNVSQSDVVSYAAMIGRAMNGQATLLKRSLKLTEDEVKAIDALNDRTEKAEMLTDLLNKRYGEANQILSETASGGLLQTRNALGDLQEMIGEKLAPYIAEFERAFLTIIQPAVEWLIENLDTLIPVLIGTAAVLGIIVATIAIVNFGPLLLLVGVIGLVIYAIIEWQKKQDELTGTTHSSLGLIMGMLTTFVAFVYDIIIVPIWNAVAAVANFVGNVFNDPIASVKILFLDLATTIMNIASAIAGVLDALFGSSIQSTIDSWIGSLDQVKKEVKAASSWEEIMPTLENWDINEAAKAGYDFGEEMSTNISKAIDNNDFFNKFGEAIGLGEDGSPALKTTSSDKLGEEDIQFLLDVATRDFKLNYQQITPDITITFGDVYETADVEVISEAIATQLEEALDYDLEVVPA